MQIVIGLTFGLSPVRTDGDAVQTNDAVATLAEWSRDRIVFDTGAAFGADRLGMPLPDITTDAADGAAIQVRAVRADNGAEVYGWRDVGTASGGGLTGAVLSEPANARTPHWLRLQARVANSTVPADEMTGVFAAGHVIDLWGQSEFHRAVLSSFNGPTPPQVADADALQITFSDANGGGYGSNLQHVFVGANAYTNIDGKLTAMANLLAAERPGEKFHVVFHTSSGTAATALVDDTNDNRQWSQDAAITAFALGDGQHPGLAIQSWYAADAPTLTGNYGNFWLRAISGLNPDGSPETSFDHHFADIYDYSRTKWAIAGPHRFESNNFDNAIPLVRGALDEAFDNPVLSDCAVRVLEPLAYLNGAPNGTDISHPQAGSLDGISRLMELTGYAMLQGLGLGQPSPVLDQWSYDEPSGTLTIGSSAGPITTTRAARGEMGTLPAGRPEVYAVQVNGTPTANATLGGGDIVVTGLAAGDSVVVGGQSIGTEAIPDDLTVNEVWKDWPLVDLGQSQIEGLPVRGYAVIPDGVIPAATAPAGYDPAQSVAHPDYKAGLENSGDGGWVNRNGTSGTFNGDGTVSLDTDNGLVVANQKHATTTVPDQLKGTLTDIAYYLTSPDGASGTLTVSVVSDGGGATVSHDSVTLDIATSLNTLLTFQVTPAANRGRLEVQFQRSGAGESGTVVVQAPVLRPAP